MKRVLSGIRATGRLHLGNYLGAVKGMLALQDSPDFETFYMVADLHSITTPFEPAKLRKNIKEVVMDYLAAGLDPEKSGIFVQSHVPEHVEFAHLLSTMVTVARMQHLPTYKEKVKQHPQNVNMALLNYPVLMAADILIYKATDVPVGDDQIPHLEVAREIARKLNEKYGLLFPEPVQFATEGRAVPSLAGEGKMSKTTEGSFILLTDDMATIKEGLARVPTDAGRGKALPATGGVRALFTLVELFEGKQKREEYEEQYLAEGVRYAQLKEELAGAIYEQLKPIQEARASLEKDPEKVERVLEAGAQKARKVASQTLQEVKQAMGLI